MFYRHRAVWGIILTLLMTICNGCYGRTPQIHEYSRESFLMGTLISIKVCTSEPELGRKSLEEAFAEFTRIAQLTDKFVVNSLADPEISDVYRINQNAGVKPVRVSEDTLTMLERCNYFALLSDGAFDVTVGPIMDLWGFGQPQYHVPSDEELKTKLALVGYRQIVIDKAQKTVFLPEEGMAIDLGGIVKGYATDKAVQKLREMGISSAIINAGGNIYAMGLKPDGTPWLTGIQDPRDNNKLIALLRVNDKAVVTSGDYERNFIRNGICYHHILCPATGKPARKAISTTIIAPSSTDADILSTTLFVLGPEKGVELIDKFADTDAVFIDSQQEIKFSRGVNEQIEFVDGIDYKVNE